MKKILLSAAITTLYASVGMAQVVGDNSFEIQSRMAYFDVEMPLGTSTSSRSTSGADDFRQAVLAHQIKYASPMINNMIGFNGNLFHADKLRQGGKSKDEMLPAHIADKTLKDEYTVLGEAYIKLNYDNLFNAKIGRQFHSSLLLKSTTSRALPDTYSGYTFNFYPATGLRFYAHQYDKVLARNSDKFDKFQTEATGASPGEIKYIRLLGGEYKLDRWQINLESLNSKEYLQKYAAVLSYTLPLADKDSLKLSTGYATSSDAGVLFKSGAEKELQTGQATNSGKGLYLDGEWKKSLLTLGLTVAKFDGLWIEDNYASPKAYLRTSNTDPGTSFFPTQSNGNDMANHNEFVRAVRVAYDWRNYVPGLTTTGSFKMGTGAKPEVGSGGPAKEYERSVGFKYLVPQVKNLSVSYLYLNFGSSNADGLKAIQSANGLERIDHRFYVDYSYKF